MTAVSDLRWWPKVLVTLLVLWAVSAVVVEGSAYLDIGIVASSIPIWAVVSQYIIATCSGALALVLVWRLPSRVDAVSLAVHLALFAVAHSLLVEGAGSPSAWHRMGFAGTGAGALAGFVGFTRVFPQPMETLHNSSGTPSYWTRVTTWAWILAVPYAGLLYWTYARYGDEFGMMLVERYVPGARVAVVFVAIGFLAAILVGVLTLRQRYARSDADDRRRILVVVAGYFLSFFALLALTALLGIALASGSRTLITLATMGSYVLWPVAVLPVLGTLFAAVYFTSAFDPRLAIRRTAVYGSVLIGSTFVFAGLEELLTSQVTRRLGLPDMVGAWIAGGAVALAIAPLKDIVDKKVRGKLAVEGEPARR